MAVSRRGLFKRVALAAAVVPLGREIAPRVIEPDAVIAPVSGFDRKMMIEATQRAVNSGILSYQTAFVTESTSSTLILDHQVRAALRRHGVA